jgi:hypothetical protein
VNPGSAQHVQDFRDQDGVCSTEPAVSLEQTWRGVKQEREQQAFRLGQVEGVFQDAPGGARVPELVTCDRFEQPSLNFPEMGVR